MVYPQRMIWGMLIFGASELALERFELGEAYLATRL